MEFNAVILAGGRATRLGGVPKPGLKYDGGTLLSRTLQAVRGASSVVVVGPDGHALPHGVLSAREEPAFAGPAAAIAAGLAALRKSGDASPWTLVLACDMPHASRGIPSLWEQLEAHPHVDGAMAVSADDRKQPLLGIYRTSALEKEVAVASEGAGLTNSSVFRLLARLNLLGVTVPNGSTDDVDTWDDAAALGIHNELEADMKGQEETLEEWCRTLLQAFELEGVEVDINEVLAVAGVAAHSVVRPAAPLTTFIAGYAAGMARGIGQANDDAAMSAALGLARQVAKQYLEPGTEAE
ncbi:NTP transferase domain-containing protein [Paenarthrobacter sp. NPDC089322]|uniref:NTP transferase domain-containing protein n=1 Tax=Paenarthrobacter sp. NPDC089322 TaxID=3155065 RepID=UPI0034266B39